jgi:hypothetical protein
MAMAAQDFGGDIFGGIGLAGDDEVRHSNLPKQRLGGT